MFRRKSLAVKLLSILMLSAMILSACAPATAVSPTQVEKAAAEQPKSNVTLVIWGEGTTIQSYEADPKGEGKGKYLKTIIDAFQKDHPGVTVKFEQHGWDEELRQNLSNALLAGTAPDIIVGEGFFKNYAQLGALVPIDITQMKDNLVMGTLQGATLNGKVYGLSTFTSIFGFERNCDVIKKAGLDCNNPPKTWDDLLAQAEQITKAGNGEYYGYSLQGPAGFSMGAAFRNYVYTLQAGAAMSKPDPSGLDYPYFNDPKAVPVYEFLRKLNKSTPPGLTFEADEGKLYTQLFQGKSAYQMAGGWHVSWAKESGCTSCQYSDIPLPAGGKPASVVVANVIYGVLNQSKNKELAVDFVKYFMRDDVQANVFMATGRLPTTKTALKALRPSVDPATQAYIDILLNNGDNLYAMPQWPKNTQKIWTYYGDFLTKLYTTDAPVQGLLDELQKASEESMK